jgi:hypothetical protein
VTIPHWERGEAAARLTAPEARPLVVAALGGSVGTRPEGLEAEVVRFTSLAALRAAAPGSLSGRIAFVDQRMRRTRNTSGYHEAVPARTLGAAAAAKVGAVAILIRSITAAEDDLPHTGRVIYEPSTPAIPAAALAPRDADLLSDQIATAAAAGKAARVWLQLTSRSLPETDSANLVGEVRGRERPDEVVLIGAHLDSWDLGPSAQDDGAGVGVVLAVAHLIAELPTPPRRTVRVVLFANEEDGLSGARAYAEGHATELPKHVVAMEADNGTGRVYQLGGSVLPGREATVNTLQQLLKSLGVSPPFASDAEGGADLAQMREGGVPVLALIQDVSAYFDVHHSAGDTLDKIDTNDLRQVVAAYAVATWLAAEEPVPPPVPALESAYAPGHPMTFTQQAKAN